MARTKAELYFDDFAEFPDVWSKDTVYVARDSNIMYRYDPDISDYVSLNATWGWDVNWPASSVDGDIVVFNWNTGKIVKDSGKKIADLMSNCTVVSKSTNYTLTGSEANNTWFFTDTSSWNITYTLDPSLFPTTNGLYEFTFCKSTNNANTVTIDVGSGNTIDTAQTYVLSNYWETVTIRIVSSTFAKVVATSNRTIPVTQWGTWATTASGARTNLWVAYGTTSGTVLEGSNDALYPKLASANTFTADQTINSSSTGWQGLKIDANTITWGRGLFIDTNNASFSGRLLWVRNDNASNTGTTAYFQQDNSTWHNIFATWGINYFSGNVWIGTTSPSDKLETTWSIRITDNTWPILRMARNGASYLWANWIWADMRIAVWSNSIANNNTKMIVKDNGKVLIGTTTAGGSILRVVWYPTSSVWLSSWDHWNNLGIVNVV